MHKLRDTTCADAYCALGGCAISPKVAQFVGERLDLQPWGALVSASLSRKSGYGKTATKGQQNLEETKARLLRVLLEVYMSGGEATESHSARLLNSQGGKMDVLDVSRTKVISRSAFNLPKGPVPGTSLVAVNCCFFLSGALIATLCS